MWSRLIQWYRRQQASEDALKMGRFGGPTGPQSLRCSVCNANWPVQQRFTTCPRCGEETTASQSPGMTLAVADQTINALRALADHQAYEAEASIRKAQETRDRIARAEAEAIVAESSTEWLAMDEVQLRAWVLRGSVAED